MNRPGLLFAVIVLGLSSAASAEESLVFASFTKKESEIREVSKVGGEATTLFTDATQPQCSSDGKTLAYLARRKGEEGVIYVTVKNGKVPKRVTNTGMKVENYALSPDGTEVAFEADKSLYVVNADGTGLKKLVGVGRNPQWSAYGQHIIYNSYADRVWGISTIKPDGSEGKVLTKGRFQKAANPVSSPDGKQIALLAVSDLEEAKKVRDTSGMDELPMQVSVMSVEGTQDVVYASYAQYAGLTWSPDGKEIAFVALNVTGKQVMMAVDIATRKIRKIAVSPAGKMFPQWSADGKKIAYQIETSGKTDIWIVNADGSDPVNVSKTPDRDENFHVWCP